jgi:hypothetical protein
MTALTFARHGHATLPLHFPSASARCRAREVTQQHRKGEKNGYDEVLRDGVRRF